MPADILKNENVAVIKAEKSDYAKDAPYHPAHMFPEYMFGKEEIASSDNYVYDSVREAFVRLNLDSVNLSTKNWNPLKDIIKPGDFVVLKPNFVIDRHEKDGELFSIITHPSVIRAVCDYVMIALHGDGEILIADAPNANADFDNLIKQTHLQDLIDFYQEKTSVRISFVDLRQLVLNDYTDSSTRNIKDRDPKGYSIVDMTEHSELKGLANIERIYGADHDRREIREHHNAGKHEYCVANSILYADVIINIPKIKTHRKAGVTLSMKNLVGINGNKNFLPHFRIGTPEDGGDEYRELSSNQKKTLYTKRFLKDKLLTKNSHLADSVYAMFGKFYGIIKKCKLVESTDDVINTGNWSGNETIWRMIIDLNRILIYADETGQIKNCPQRKYLSVLDGIWAGENEGPLIPTKKEFGYIIAGFNPLLTDLVTVKMMGFDYRKIPLLAVASNEVGIGLCLSEKNGDSIKISSNLEELKDYKTIDMSSHKFRAAEGWKDVLN